MSQLPHYQHFSPGSFSPPRSPSRGAIRTAAEPSGPPVGSPSSPLSQPLKRWSIGETEFTRSHLAPLLPTTPSPPPGAGPYSINSNSSYSIDSNSSYSSAAGIGAAQVFQPASPPGPELDVDGSGSISSDVVPCLVLRGWFTARLKTQTDPRCKHFRAADFGRWGEVSPGVMGG